MNLVVNDLKWFVLSDIKLWLDEVPIVKSSGSSKILERIEFLKTIFGGGNLNFLPNLEELEWCEMKSNMNSIEF